MFVVVSCSCWRVFCVSVSPIALRDDDYSTESIAFHEPEDDFFEAGLSSTPEEYEVENKFSKTMIDHDEQRVRNLISDHEIPKQTPVKVKIVGDLATPPPGANINLGFVPKQTYVQVRRYDNEIHLPRSAALAEAETAEELLNAPRLREVVSQKKTQEVSTSDVAQPTFTCPLTYVLTTKLQK